MNRDLIIGMLFLLCLHASIWLSTTYQFIDFEAKPWLPQVDPFYFMLCLSIPTALFGYYASMYCYDGAGESAWAIKFITSGTSYIVFPLMTWYFLDESFFTLKTMLCVFLSFLIIAIQIKL